MAPYELPSASPSRKTSRPRERCMPEMKFVRYRFVYVSQEISKNSPSRTRMRVLPGPAPLKPLPRRSPGSCEGKCRLPIRPPENAGLCSRDTIFRRLLHACPRGEETLRCSRLGEPPAMDIHDKAENYSLVTKFPVQAAKFPSSGTASVAVPFPVKLVRGQVAALRPKPELEANRPRNSRDRRRLPLDEHFRPRRKSVTGLAPQPAERPRASPEHGARVGGVDERNGLFPFRPQPSPVKIYFRTLVNATHPFSGKVRANVKAF